MKNRVVYRLVTVTIFLLLTINLMQYFFVHQVKDKPRLQPVNTSRSVFVKTIHVEDGKIILNKTLYQHLDEPSAQLCGTTRWKTLLDTCEMNMDWQARARNLSERTEAKNSKVHIYIPLDGSPAKIELFTFDKKKRQKFRGGDHWRAKLKNQRNSYALQFTDQNDGRYIGYFSVLQAGVYTLDIFLEHSLCEGLTNPPKDWFLKGNLHGGKQPPGTIGYVDQFLNDPIGKITLDIPVQQNPNKSISKDNGSCTVINQNCGHWDLGRFVDNFGKNISVFKIPELAAHQRLPQLFLYGDSLQYYFAKSLQRHPICQKLFTKCVNRYTWTYQHFHKNTHFDLTIKTKVDFNESKFINDILADVTSPPMRTSKSVFVINFGAHNIRNIPLARLFNLFDLFIKMVLHVRKDLGDNCPLIIWKTTTPPAIENVKNQRNTDMRFITKQRIEVWNSYTLGEACKANIPVLDVYDMALSYPYGTLDHIHYRDNTFKSAEDDLMNYILRKYNLL